MPPLPAEQLLVRELAGGTPNVALAAVRALRVGVLLALAHLHARIISRVPGVAERALHHHHVSHFHRVPGARPYDEHRGTLRAARACRMLS